MKICIGMATIKSRKDILPYAIESLKNQTVNPDVIKIYANDYKPCIDDEMVEVYVGEDLSDRGKFKFINESKDSIYFSCDDDLIYANDYIEKTLQGLERYPKHVVSWHGRKLKGKGLNYYFGNTQYNFMSTIQDDKPIEVPGTGVSAFNTEHFLPDVIQYPEQCMADLLLGLEMAKNGVKGVCLKHRSQWIRSMHSDETIYHNESRKCGRQSDIADQIWDLLN